MSNLKNNRIFRAVFSVTGVLLLAKLLGFVKQMVTAGIFGATIETDLISLSQNFIGDIQYVLVQTLLTAFVAVYIHTQEKDREQADKFAVASGKAFTAIAAGLVCLVVLFAPLLAKIIAPSYSPENSARLAGYLRIFAPALLLFVWIAVFHALLDANQRFVPGQMEGLNQSVILIILVSLLQPRMGVSVLVLAFFVYTIWNAAFLGVISRPYWRNAGGNPFRNPAVRELLHMVGPLLLGYSMVYVNQQVDKILSSGLMEGTVTAMGYAAVLSNLVGTFVGTFCGILFTYITACISKGEEKAAAELTTKSALLLVMVFLPISILTVLFAEDIVTIVFGRGAFRADVIHITASALQGYGYMFVPLVLREIYSRLQYGYQDSKTPMINSTIAIVGNIILSIALCPVLGVFGITVASSISVLICGVLNAATARKHNRALSFEPLLRKTPWLCLGGGGCAAAAIWCGTALAGESALFRFLSATICGSVMYVVILLPLVLGILRDMRKK